MTETDTGTGLLQRARALYDADRLDESQELFSQLARSTSAQQPDGWYGLGLIALARASQETAAEYFKSALIADPRHQHALYWLGEIAARAGRDDEARSYFSRVLEIDPAHARARRRLAGASSSDGAAVVATAPPASPPSPRAAPALPPQRDAADYGAYAFLLADDSPQSKATLDMIDRVRRSVRPTASAYLGRFVASGLLAFALALTLAAIVAHNNAFATVRGPNPFCDRLPPDARAQCQATLGEQTRRVKVRSSSPERLWPLLVGLPAAVLVLMAVRVTSTRYEVERGRVRITRGALGRRVRTIELFKVRSVEVRQGPFNRLTGDGALVLEIEDSQQPVSLLGIARPPELDRLGAQLQDLVLSLRRNRALQGIVL